tara:strand:+ start:378 stop:776 length:399 start_codon:yes stop_codon:yes gene_type:complete
MPNKTEQCIQDNLFAAQADLAPHGISLGLKDIATNAKRVIYRGVITIKDSAVNSHRSAQRQRGDHISTQDYAYPLKDQEGNCILDENKKKVKVLLPYGVIKRVDPKHANELRLKLVNQAEGLQEIARQMAEV